MTKYCLDTNAVSDIMISEQNVIINLKHALDLKSQIFVPSIVYYEIIRGLKASGQTRRLKEFLALYENAKHLYFDKENLKVIEKAADIYVQLRKGKQIEDNDVYIAAMSIVNNCTLVTANEKHFGRIEELSFVNWRNLEYFK